MIDDRHQRALVVRAQPSLTPHRPFHTPRFFVLPSLQAAARVWRDGQRKKVFVYRFLATGTLEEKVFQRQLSKKGLQTIVVEEGDEVRSGGIDCSVVLLGGTPLASARVITP